MLDIYVRRCLIVGEMWRDVLSVLKGTIYKKGKNIRPIWVSIIMDFIANIAGGSLLKASLYKILSTLCEEQSDSSPWQKYKKKN